MFLSSKEGSKQNIIISIILFLLAILLAVGVYYYTQTQNQKQVQKEGYQAVFLTNGQVYFGNITEKSDRWINMKDIYYLQLKHSLQDQKSKADLSESDVTLAKLGNEIHGPKDSMEVNRDHVLFIENLSKDSKVLSAIQEHKNNKVTKK